MAAVEPPKPKPKPGKGSGLSRKVGPLPLVAWAGIGLAAVAILYLRSKRVTTSTVPTDTTSPASGGVDLVTGGTAAQQAYGGGPSANASPYAQLSPEVQQALTDYRGSLADSVLTAFDTGNAQLAGIISSYGGTQPTSSTAQVSAPVAAKATASKPKPATATQTKKVAATQPAPATKYYTYKKDVVVKKGQSLKFRAGKGYYAG